MAYFNLDDILKNITYEPQLTLLAQISKDEDDGEFVDRRRFCIDNKWYIFVDSMRAKIVVGPDYNYIFLKDDGSFIKWGVDITDAPHIAPIGPEILYIEIFKNNHVMSLDLFMSVVSKVSRNLNRIVFLYDGDATNLNVASMLIYCHDLGIVVVEQYTPYVDMKDIFSSYIDIDGVRVD